MGNSQRGRETTQRPPRTQRGGRRVYTVLARNLIPSPLPPIPLRTLHGIFL